MLIYYILTRKNYSMKLLSSRYDIMKSQVQLFQTNPINCFRIQRNIILNFELHINYHKIIPFTSVLCHYIYVRINKFRNAINSIQETISLVFTTHLFQTNRKNSFGIQWNQTLFSILNYIIISYYSL